MEFNETQTFPRNTDEIIRQKFPTELNSIANKVGKALKNVQVLTKGKFRRKCLAVTTKFVCVGNFGGKLKVFLVSIVFYFSFS